MDGLADYGSDSEPSVAAESPEKEEEGLSDVLADGYGDHDNDNNDHESRLSSALPDMTGTRKSVGFVESAVRRKRQRRRWDDAPEPNQNEKLPYSDERTLPPPRLLSEGDDDAFLSLVLFPVNYLASQKTQPPPGGDGSRVVVEERKERLMEKLDQMYQRFRNTDDSFANHLTSQTEFGNPHMFPSIIQHFGIDSPLGSNLPTSLWNPEGGEFKHYEYGERIVEKEEENRIRAMESAQQQQQQQGSKESEKVVVDFQIQLAMGGSTNKNL